MRSLPRSLKSFLAALLITTLGSGCATSTLLHQATPRQEERSSRDPCDQEPEQIPGNKAAYFGLPFAAAWDIATAPFLIGWIAYLKAIGFNG